MANKTVVTIDYDVGNDGEIQIASNGDLTEDENIQAMTITGKLNLIRICKIVDKFLRDNDIAEIGFKEEGE